MTILEQMAKANAEVKTIDVKGKSYVMVNERIKAFRKVFPTGTISTEIVADDGERVTIKAWVYDNDRLLATGHAFEVKSTSYINKTSYIENCETSAVGRALGFLGFGCDDSLASAEEVKNAIEGQATIKANEAKPDNADAIRKKPIGKKRGEALAKELINNGADPDKVCEWLGAESMAAISEGQQASIIKQMARVAENCPLGA